MLMFILSAMLVMFGVDALPQQQGGFLNNNQNNNNNNNNNNFNANQYNRVQPLPNRQLQYNQQQQAVYAQQQGGPVIPITSYQNEVNYDGSYKYSYTSADGSQQQATGYVKNLGQKDLEAQVVQGSYSYISPDGTPITVTYIADENGFRADGAHLPTPPPIPEAIAKSLAYQQQQQQFNTNQFNQNQQNQYNQNQYSQQQSANAGGGGYNNNINNNNNNSGRYN